MVRENSQICVKIKEFWQGKRKYEILIEIDGT